MDPVVNKVQMCMRHTAEKYGAEEAAVESITYLI